MVDAMERGVPGPLVRFLALCAAYVTGAWLIALLAGAPLSEAFEAPFMVFVPLGLIAVGFGALLILVLRRLGQSGPWAHMIGSVFVPFLTVVAIRLVLGGIEGLRGLFDAPWVLASFAAGGVLAGVVLWSLRRLAGDL